MLTNQRLACAFDSNLCIYDLQRIPKTTLEGWAWTDAYTEYSAVRIAADLPKRIEPFIVDTSTRFVCRGRSPSHKEAIGVIVIPHSNPLRATKFMLDGDLEITRGEDFILGYDHSIVFQPDGAVYALSHSWKDVQCTSSWKNMSVSRGVRYLVDWPSGRIVLTHIYGTFESKRLTL